MNLSESLSLLANKIDSLSQLDEDKGHLDHPEDLVFLQSSKGAQQAIAAMQQTVANPKTVTIKWDGYPALIFGRGTDGKFSIMDKHMFNKKDGTGRLVFSPTEFVEYDKARGVDRSGLYSLIAEIWPGLEKADNSKGFYWGDLLFSKPLVAGSDGLYRFKANPNGITYTVEADSDVGKIMAKKNAGIAVHQFIPADAPTTDYATPLHGSIGKLKNNSDVAIVPSAMPTTPNLKIDSKLLKAAQDSIAKHGAAVDQLMDTAPQARNTFNQLFTTYINKKIISGDLQNLLGGFEDYVQARPMTEVMRGKIMQHLQQNKNGLIGAFTVWAAIYKLKMSIVSQLDAAAAASPVKGYLQNGVQSQEGFVSNGLKFVDRMGFSRQNLAGR